MHAGEQGIKPDFAQLTAEAIPGDPTKLIPVLLDQLVALGEMARQLSHALGGNGYRSEKVAELIEQLTKRVDDAF